MKLYQVSTSAHKQQVRTLFWEYLQWANDNVNREFDVNFDIVNMLEEDMNTLGKFLPPNGRLVLAQIESDIAGLACMKKLSDEICEIKRMYVRPNFRKQGVGRAMLQHLIDEARAMGYGQMYLDSANFMQAAHALYRSMGFRTIEPYDGSEIPQDFQKHWQFMALVL